MRKCINARLLASVLAGALAGALLASCDDYRANGAAPAAAIEPSEKPAIVDDLPKHEGIYSLSSDDDDDLLFPGSPFPSPAAGMAGTM